MELLKTWKCAYTSTYWWMDIPVLQGIWSWHALPGSAQLAHVISCGLNVERLNHVCWDRNRGYTLSGWYFWASFLYASLTSFKLADLFTPRVRYGSRASSCTGEIASTSNATTARQTHLIFFTNNLFQKLPEIPLVHVCLHLMRSAQVQKHVFFACTAVYTHVTLKPCI